MLVRLCRWRRQRVRWSAAATPPPTCRLCPWDSKNCCSKRQKKGAVRAMRRQPSRGPAQGAYTPSRARREPRRKRGACQGVPARMCACNTWLVASMCRCMRRSQCDGAQATCACYQSCMPVW
eukprot:1157517-Pelagomonas_calceolata.AAC.6